MSVAPVAAVGAARAAEPRPARSSWRHRKQVEEEACSEGLAEWQVNSYYAAGRVLVPALLDVFTSAALFKWRQLLDLLLELAGDDGRPRGAMLHQVPVPLAYVGRTYGELVSALLLVGGTAQHAQHAEGPQQAQRAREGQQQHQGAPSNQQPQQPQQGAAPPAPLPAPYPHEVALGLLRRKSENRGWRLPYVALHPAPSTVLEITDCVFLVRPR